MSKLSRYCSRKLGVQILALFEIQQFTLHCLPARNPHCSISALHHVESAPHLTKSAPVPNICTSQDGAKLTDLVKSAIGRVNFP